MSSVVGRKESMSRLLVHVEGETEERFVNQVLRPHFTTMGYVSVVARIFGNARQRSRRGGIRSWQSTKTDILRHLRQDPDLVTTTMVDYYGLPQGQDRGWPGRAEASNASFETKANVVEAALSRAIASGMGWQNSYQERFVPFVVMHEFEALLFSDCLAFAVAIGRPALASNFQEIRNAFPTPEEINDSPLTAPSKRIADLVPGYQKPLLGTTAALEVGLSAIRGACPHFDAWMTLLESRSASATTRGA